MSMPITRRRIAALLAIVGLVVLTFPFASFGQTGPTTTRPPATAPPAAESPFCAFLFVLPEWLQTLLEELYGIPC